MASRTCLLGTPSRAPAPPPRGPSPWRRPRRVCSVTPVSVREGLVALGTRVFRVCLLRGSACGPWVHTCPGVTWAAGFLPSFPCRQQGHSSPSRPSPKPLPAPQQGVGPLAGAQQALTSALTAPRWRPRSRRMWLCTTRARGMPACWPQTASSPSCSASWTAASTAWPSSPVSSEGLWATLSPRPARLRGRRVWGADASGGRARPGSQASGPTLFLLLSPRAPRAQAVRVGASLSRAGLPWLLSPPRGPQALGRPPAWAQDRRKPPNAACGGGGEGSRQRHGCWELPPPPLPLSEGGALGPTLWEPQSEQKWSHWSHTGGWGVLHAAATHRTPGDNLLVMTPARGQQRSPRGFLSPKAARPAWGLGSPRMCAHTRTCARTRIRTGSAVVPADSYPLGPV